MGSKFKIHLDACHSQDGHRLLWWCHVGPLHQIKGDLNLFFLKLSLHGFALYLHTIHSGIVPIYLCKFEVNPCRESFEKNKFKSPFIWWFQTGQLSMTDPPLCDTPHPLPIMLMMSCDVMWHHWHDVALPPLHSWTLILWLQCKEFVIFEF